MTRLLMITNEGEEGTEYGLRDEFGHLLAEGRLEAYDAVAPVALLRGGLAWDTVVQRVVSAAEAVRPTVLLVLSPKAGSWVDDDVRRILHAAGSPHVAYWEGDPWGRRHRPTPSMHPWLSAADQVFSVALGEQDDVLRAAGARRVRFVPHTYCHVQFAADEEHWAPPSPGHERRVVMVASRGGRIPGVSTVPGARDRWRLARSASRRFGDEFTVFGRGWSGPSAAGSVPFADQVRALRSGGLSINWDHYPHHAAYASDRLPNSLLAGRPHVTTRHPSLDVWTPGSAEGLFLADSPGEVVDLADRIRRLPAEEQEALGRRAYDWVRDRLSDRQAARYLLRESAGLDLPLPDPWDAIARLGDGRGPWSAS